MKAYSSLLVVLLPLIVPAILPLISPVRASSVMWSKTYTGTPYETAESVIETSDGGYALAGYKGDYTDPFTHADFWLIKTDEYGIIPEFPSWTSLLTILVVAVAITICYRCMLRKQ